MTATIMESYDAQMLDYQNDHDVQMQLSSSDPWLQDVAPMDDDGHLIFQPKGAMTDTLPTIEVDMEAYAEDEHIEYEMVDDHHGHNLTSGELLDVDVFDASAVQSPLATVTPLPLTPSVEQPQLPTDPVPLAEDSPVAASQTVQDHQAHASVPENSKSITVPQSDAISASLIPVVLPEPHSALDADTNASEQPFPVSHESEAVESPPEPMQHFDTTPPALDVPLRTDDTPAAGLTIFTLNKDQFDSHYHDPTHQPAEPTSGISSNTEAPVVSGESLPPPKEVGERPLEQPHGTDNPSSSDGLPLTTSVSRQHAQEPANEATEHVLDAHAQDPSRGPLADEIAETVNDALDEGSEQDQSETPPPILLSIFSTDHPELCLFNKPSEPLPNEDESQECHILFQQAASLFWEPLANVFEALRQDEYVSTVLEVAGNELGLEAYELDLAITEDNYYGREISLQDIYALHNSANLAGPLRLRLYISGARFIVRYHMLQEGLAHLHVDESQDSDHDETDDSQLDNEHDEDVYEHDDGLGEEQVSGKTGFNASEANEGQPEEENVHDQPDNVHGATHDGEADVPEQTGEIDLSTLPPFVDSPEVAEDDEQEQDTNPADGPPSESTPSGDTARNEDLTQNSIDLKDESTLEILKRTEPEDFTRVRAAASTVEDEAVIEHGYSEEDTGVIETNTEEDQATVSDIQPYGGQIDTAVPEHTEEHREKTPQSEQVNLTNEKPTARLEIIVGAEKDEQPKPTEATSEDAFLESGVNAIGELQDFGGDTWDDELDGEGDPDTTWEAEKDNGDESISNESSVTLSSKASKRSFDDFGLEHSDDENLVSESPGSKRPRIA